ncbi:hypothetical protein X975_18284, partial [Stegodyphus mimosarum]
MCLHCKRRYHELCCELCVDLCNTQTRKRKNFRRGCDDSLGLFP